MINGGIAQESIKLTTDENTHSIKLAGDLGITGPTPAAVKVVTIDLSGLSATGGTLIGNIKVDAADTKIETVNGSHGDDTINLSAAVLTAPTDGTAKIYGGDGNDTIMTGAITATASYTLTGGAGNDTFDISASKLSGATQSYHTTITDFSAGDSIRFSSTKTDAVKAIVTPATSDKDTLVDAIKAAWGSDTVAVHTVTILDYTGTEKVGDIESKGIYLIYNGTAKSGSDKTTAADDIVVKLDGITNASDLKEHLHVGTTNGEITYS